jgi:hypothetical protein
MFVYIYMCVCAQKIIIAKKLLAGRENKTAHTFWIETLQRTCQTKERLQCVNNNCTHQCALC